MKVIGLTGGIGSGKSTVARLLAGLGAVVIDTDKVGHQAFAPGTEGWQEVVAAFGRQVLTTAGEIDRQKLAEVVFGSPEALARLNGIMHPRIYRLVREQIEEHRRRGVAVVVLEVPLLVEAGWAAHVDEVWVVTAPEAAVRRRLAGRAGLSHEQALARIRAQLPDEARLEHADVVINNDGSQAELSAAVERLWAGRKVPGKGQ